MQIDDATMEELKAQACEILGRESLNEQLWDAKDFFEIHVLRVQEILKMAYAAGHQQGQLDSH